MLKEGQYSAVYGDFYGTPKELWGFRYETRRGSPRDRAKQFLRENAGLLKLDPSLAGLRCSAERQSLRATHLQFEQRIEGELLHRGVISVHLDRRGAVYLARNRTTPETIEIEEPEVELTRADAMRIAKKLLVDRKKGRLKAVGKVQFLWYPVLHYLAPAFRVRLSRRRPAELWDVIVHAGTGEILWKYDNVALARALIFDPSPVTKVGDHALFFGPRGGLKRPLEETYVPVRLSGLDRSGFLQNSRIIVRSVSSPRRAGRKNGGFVYHAHEKQFEHVMAYHHVERAMRYLEDLGYRGEKRLFRQRLLVDPRATREDNAYYDPATHSLAFGTGEIDEAEDGETILHEFGHAIQDAICKDFGLSEEAAALGEGFGDYFAGSFFEGRKPHRYRPAVMSWDGLLIGIEEGREPPCMRRLDVGVTYEDYKPKGDEHENGEIWAATLWDVRRVLNPTRSRHAKRADRTIIESHFQLDSHATFSRAARAIIDANDNLNGGENRRALRNVFERRAIDLDGK